MKKLFLFLTCFTFLSILAVASYGQSFNEIEMLSQIDKKQTAAYGDAVTLFVLQLGKTPSSFSQDSEVLITEGFGLAGYSEDTLLTKGMMSKMAAKYLNLSGSFMYVFLDTERYAFKTCIANGLFASDGSENDNVNGPALIEFFSKISEIKGEQK